MLCEVPTIVPLIPSSAIIIVPLILLNLQKLEILLFLVIKDLLFV